MDKKHKCSGCGKEGLDSELKFTKIESGKFYCESCLDQYTTVCALCGKRHHNNYISAKIIYINGRKDVGKICRECVAKAAEKCCRCGALIPKNDKSIVLDSDGRIYCKEHGEEIVTCIESGKKYHKTYMIGFMNKDKSWSYIHRDLFSLQIQTKYQINDCSICGRTYSGIGYDDRVVNKIGDVVIKQYHICPEHMEGMIIANCGHSVSKHAGNYITVETPFLRKLEAAKSILEGTAAPQANVDCDGVLLDPSHIFDSSVRPTRVVMQPTEPSGDTYEDPAAHSIFDRTTPQERYMYTKHLISQNLKRGNIICQHCHENSFHEIAEISGERRASEGFVNSSHVYSPDVLYFHGEPETISRDEDLFMGFELEVDSEGRDTERTAKEVYKNVGARHVYIKRDGSLRCGFEQVIHPSTLKYLLKNRERYENLLKIPKEAGFYSHDIGTCGLHVHIDRGFYPEYTQKQKLMQLGVLTELFWPELFIFSRRKGTDDMRWAKRMFSLSFQAKTMISGNIDAMMKEWESYYSHPSERYRTLNLNRSSTAEFRIFRGTLNPITFWATLQLVNNMVKINKETPKDKVLGLKWMDIINYEQYPELLDYNSRMVGDGWNGKKKIKIVQLADEASSMVTLEIPQSLDKSNIKTIKYVTFTRQSEIVKSIFRKYGKKFISEGKMWVFTDNSIAEDMKKLTNIPTQGGNISIDSNGLLSINGSSQSIVYIYIDVSLFDESIIDKGIVDRFKSFVDIKVREGFSAIREEE